MTFTVSRDGAGAASLGFQCLTIIIIKILPYVQSKPTLFQFKTITHMSYH